MRYSLNKIFFKNSITKYLIEEKSQLEISIFPLFINCTISIFSLCFMIDVLSFFHDLINDKLLEKILFIITSGLGGVFVVALQYSFFLFVKSLSEKYELLLILGIKAKDFMRLASKEYVLEIFWLGIKEILISNILCFIMLYIIFYNTKISIMMVAKQLILTTGVVFLVYILILLLTMFCIFINSKKKNLIIFFEQFSRDNLNKKDKKGYRIFLKPILGSSFIILSFLMLINFRVEKMIIAIGFNIWGAFLVIHSDCSLIKKAAKILKKLYYKNVLTWPDIIYQYKINSNLIFILYLLNFLLVYLMGGLMVSFDSGSDFDNKYPYETIAYSDRNIDSKNSYHALLININGYGLVTAISNKDYCYLEKDLCDLKSGQVCFWDQREKDNGLPLNEKKIEVVQDDKNYINYSIKNIGWKVIFGQSVFPELNGIVVFNNDDFDLLLKNRVGTEKFIFLSNQIVSKESLRLNAGEEYWNKSLCIEKETVENRVAILLTYIISLILILEGQAFIFTKQIVNMKEEKQNYNILRCLGIKINEQEKIIEKRINFILIIPSIMAIISGILFFLMDIFQNSSGNTIFLLLKYGMVIVSFIFIEILGKYFVSYKMKKLYIDV